MYHAVENVTRPPRYKHFYVLAKEFAGQMRMLHRGGYTAITFDTLAQAKAGIAPLPEKPVLLTFDDGYANLLSNVHPLLHELGYSYTVFLVSEKVGKTNDWVADEGYEPTLLLTWDEVLLMQKGGLAHFEAHTATHRPLDRLSEEEACWEMASCKEMLEDRLGKSPSTLCYPYGSADSKTAALARECGYTMAVTTQFGRARAEDDSLLLPRISVYHVPPVSLTYGIGSLNFRWRLETRKDTRP